MLKSVVSKCGQQLRRQLSPLVLAQQRGLKETTGIVGLDVDPNARENLKEKLKSVKESLKIIPAEAFYRQWTEAAINERLEAASSTATDEEIEEQFSAPLEQIIQDCNNELALIPKMAGKLFSLFAILLFLIPAI